MSKQPHLATVGPTDYATTEQKQPVNQRKGSM
jgi:hypothetical protein